MTDKTHAAVIALAAILFAGCATAQTNAPDGAAPNPANPAPVSPARPGPQTPAPQAANALPADASVDQVLDALDERGRDLRSFEADVTLAETLAAAGATTTRSGKAYYQLRPGGEARMAVRFNKLKDEQGRNLERHLDYVLDGPNLIERNADTKTQITRQVLKPGEKVNLLRLGEGPFPLPIGQDKAEVHKQFDVQKGDPTNDDPANTIHLVLTPAAESNFARQFKKIDVWVDRTSRWPVKIYTIDPAETTERTTELKDVQVNLELPDKDFDLGPLPQGWNEQNEAFQR